jgi:hypothetical protein
VNMLSLLSLLVWSNDLLLQQGTWIFQLPL